MVSNENMYENTTPVKVIDKKTLNKMAWRSLCLQASFNYARMQAGGWLYTLLPGLRKIHKDDNDLRKSMHLHLEFFNIHPLLVTFLVGIVMALEEQKENIQTIRAIKVATMGPLGGIGDALFWFTLLPLSAGIGASMAVGDGTIGSGTAFGALFFLVVFNIVHFGARFWLIRYAYALGVESVSKLTENAQLVAKAASVVGLTVVGALVATYIHLDFGLILTAGKKVVNLQTDVIDKVMPKLLPLLYALFMYWLLKKGKNTRFLDHSNSNRWDWHLFLKNVLLCLRNKCLFHLYFYDKEKTCLPVYYFGKGMFFL